MKTATVSFACVPVSLLLIAGLLSTTACGKFSAHHGAQGESGYAHAGSTTHDGHHGGVDTKHGGDNHAMHSSGHGHHAKGHGKHGRQGKHSDTHQNVMKFIDHIMQFQEGMSLTDDQMQQLRALKTNYKKTRITMKADVKLANVDLHEIVKDEKASLADIEAKLHAMHAMKTKLYMASIKARRDANAVLSEEQQSRMGKIHERIKSHSDTMAPQGDHSGYKKHKEHGRK